MARGKPSRNVKPGPSNDAAGKLWAVCSFEPKNSRDYLKAPFYFDACRSWYKALSWQQQETGSTVIDAYTSFGEITAERIARNLPPRSPF
jgi:hypothetical protein